MQNLILLIFLQAIVSAASLVVEIVAGRMLAPYVGMSLYTWTSIIAVVLAGFSGGHWLGGRIAEKDNATALRQTAVTMAFAALTTGMAVVLLRAVAGPVISALDSPLSAIIALSMIVFFLPSFFAGVPAPVLAQISVRSQPGKEGRALGAMFAAGALGAIGGTLSAGFFFISYLGSTATLALMTALYAGVAITLFVMAGWRSASATVSGVLIFVAVATAAFSLTRESPCTVESQYFCIRVVDVSPSPEEPVRLMVLDHLVHGISGGNDPALMQTGHAAMMDGLTRIRMVEAGKLNSGFSAFFIGGGTFSIPRAWSEGQLAAVTVAEIDADVTAVAARDFWFDPAKARVVDEDARLVLTRDRTRYDVIVGDAFTDIAVPPHLVTQEFFALIKDRLSDDGIYVMNVVDHIDRLDALGAIARTLQTVFPSVEVWAETAQGDTKRLTFILVAGQSPTGTDVLNGLSPEPFTARRVPQGRLDQIVALTEQVILTDDYTPIDRLMGIRADNE